MKTFLACLAAIVSVVVLWILMPIISWAVMQIVVRCVSTERRAKLIAWFDRIQNRRVS